MATESNANAEGSAAARLLQKHAENPLHATVEDAPDEDVKPSSVADPSDGPSWGQTISSKAAGKQPAHASPPLDTQSHEAFPELGVPKSTSAAKANISPIWGGAKAGANGKANGTSWSANGTPQTSAPASGVSTPTGVPPPVSIPGRNVESVILEPRFILPRAQLKRPIPDIVKDINRKSRAIISMVPARNGHLKFEATGPQDKAQQALRDLVQQIGVKTSIKVPIPQSARAHIIGKQGATIKSIQEKSGARIQLPKIDEVAAALDEDDDSVIDVIVEGNAISAAIARDAINKIAGERSANISTKLKSVPAEFYPFIAGPNNRLAAALEAEHGIQVRVPPHQPWSESVPQVPAAGQRPTFNPPADDNYIQLAGDRAAVQAARAAIEHQARELQDQLLLDQVEIRQGTHQFIIGDRGIPTEDFFADTNCVVVLPSTPGVDTVTIIGRADDVNTGLEKAMDLATQVHTSVFDVARHHSHSAGGAPTYSRDVSRYLRQRKEIERLEKLYHIHINTPFSEGIVSPWELYAREGKNALKAQKEMSSIINGLPPSRLATVPVDSFFHTYLRNDIRPRIQSDFGVHLVVPDAADANLPVLLVYEGEAAQEEGYQVPQGVPAAAELEQFRRGLAEARNHILEIVNRQEEIATATQEVPVKLQDKLRKFIKKEQDATTRAAGDIPVRVSVKGTTVTMRGPASAVESLSRKASDFVEQEKEDEKERGYTTKFDFPQKFANHLIGKSGSHINELREKFDVDIQVQNGEVELKGPKAKAERAKTYILSLGRQWADETTHTLKIEPKYHRELIGAQGGQIHRLQNRYGVHINFPRTAKPAKDDESVDVSSDAGKPRRQQGPDEVTIRGPRKGADEARDEIFSLYEYLKDNSFAATVAVQQKQLPSLIGSGGSGMDELRQTTGAKIDIPNDRNETQDTMVEIQIKGTKAQVAAAKKIIEEKRAIFNETVTKTVEVDRKWHKNLIGPGGSTLRDIVIKAGGPEDRRLQARTIQFPKQDVDGNTIRVEGRQDVVDKIIASITAIVSERESQVIETIEVPTEKHRSLIGRGGDVKRQLESQFNVSIDIPKRGSGLTGVKLVGQLSDVEKAKEHISSLVKEQHGETIQVPRKYHLAISENGQFFRRLKNDHKVSVDHDGHSIPQKPKASSTRANNGALPLITDDADAAADVHSWTIVETASSEEGDIPWVLRGDPENVEKAKKIIATALEQVQRNNTTGYLILPDPSTYRYVIGQGGSKVNSIRKQSGCKINVPRDQARDEAIEILGSKEGCEKAKDLILEAVREGQSARRD
ncbi:putative RNA binding effector protein Scp160 [Durotheca rogersii]|uniref:putative RNA binding effector protein Scp160 n=1 Tax=Durotheca rogersii TaxID=419775 RepID=UPI0022211CB8|nr:putative RNA binding effector protein Scp160 [Durotheca rogersii]KAI5861379.1 putative RNA binding effector protein Scp160 [Durotheca rogersii]